MDHDFHATENIMQVQAKETSINGFIPFILSDFASVFDGLNQYRESSALITFYTFIFIQLARN
jgi:hypothetical protein